MISAWHAPLSVARGARGEISRKPAAREPLLLGLRLLTAVPLAEMRAFYQGLLGLAVTAESGSEITFRAGLTDLTFVAAGPEQGNDLYEQFVTAVRGQGIDVETGQFRAMMDVALVNDGPVTLLVDSRKVF